MDESAAREIAARLREKRARADLTQHQAAEAAGISWMTVHRCEHGKRLPSVEVLYALARVYGCEPADFLPPLPPVAPPARRGRKPGPGRPG